MATNKRVFTLRLNDDVFDKIGVLATKQHRSMTNYIEYVLLSHIEAVEKEAGDVSDCGEEGCGEEGCGESAASTPLPASPRFT